MPKPQFIIRLPHFDATDPIDRYRLLDTRLYFVAWAPLGPWFSPNPFEAERFDTLEMAEREIKLHPMTLEGAAAIPLGMLDS